MALWQSLLGGLRAPGEQGPSGVCLGSGSRAVPWVEEVAPVGSRAAACPSSPLGRPPSFSAALWMKCPDGQGPAGRGLGRAWNSPCSGIRFGQRPGSRGRFHLLAASSLSACLEVERQRPLQPAPPCSLGEERGRGNGTGVEGQGGACGCGTPRGGGCGMQEAPSAAGRGPPSRAAPLAVRRLHFPQGRCWLAAGPNLLCEPLSLGFASCWLWVPPHRPPAPSFGDWLRACLRSPCGGRGAVRSSERWEMRV